MKNFFTFENLGGDYPALNRDLMDGLPAAAFGLSDAQKYLIASAIKGKVVYLAADALSAQSAMQAISTLSGKKCALLAAKDEVLTYRKALSKDALFRRLSALYDFLSGAEVLVLDVEAAIQLVPRILPVFHIEEGSDIEMAKLISALVGAGYTREYTVESKGAFAVRGDILDIYPINCDHPVRIDFFGDEVEAIKPYDEITGERLARVFELDIVSATDVVPKAGDFERVKAALAAELKRAPNAAAYTRMKSISDEILSAESLSSDYVLPLLENSCPLFTLLPKDTLLIYDECKLIHDKLDGLYKEHGERYVALREGGEAMSFSLEQYVPEEDFLRSLGAFRSLALQTFTGNTYFFNPLKIYNFP
ncbi:MAG: hypothetical protein K2L87_00595, partial [Clostridiales bacterium]|nr:hypothetical protein [Clostridiales bacterium]